MSALAAVNYRIAKGLFDHLVGPAEHRERDGEAKRLVRPGSARVLRRSRTQKMPRR